jgi:hypothetical protein
MSSQELEESAVRMAMLLSTVMNMAAILANDPTLHSTDRSEFRSTLLWIANELNWARTIPGSVVWPSDAEDRITLLRDLADPWDPVVAPSAEMLSAAHNCLGMLQPPARP